MSIPTKPTLTAPPTAPQRTDPPDTFANRADAYLVWQNNYRDELVAGIDWQNTAFTATENEANNAANSATASANSATASADSATASANSATEAEGYKDTAETAAAAAQSAAGLPSLLGNAGLALAVDLDEQGVSWQDIALDSIYPTDAVRPTGGEVAESTAPPLLGGDYLPLYGIAQQQREFHIIAAGGSWSSPLYSGVEMPGPNGSAATSHVPGVSLTSGASYQWRYRDTTVTGDTGPWSPAADFVAGDSPGDMQIGDPYAGGFFAGLAVSDHDGQTYGLIVSDGSGDSVQVGAGTLQWRTANAAVSTTHGTPPMTLADGRANHDAIRALDGLSAFPAFKWVDDTCNAGAGLNGYNDWYLPGRDELELLYRHFKPTTQDNNTAARITGGFGGDGATHGTNASSVPAGTGYTAGDPSQTGAASFQSGGPDAFEADYYWSSTEYDAGGAWSQLFNNGSQYRNGKTNSYRVRAVRRVAL